MGLGRLKFNIKCDMKVKLFKGLLAVMLIGLFVSCSQKKEDFQNDKESKRMVVNKVKKDYVPEGKKFYLVDVSGSMQGKGSVRTSDIFTSVIEDMSFAFSKITDSCEIVIIPFSSMPLSPISFNSFDKENMNTALQNLTVSNGNTNIYSAFQKAVEKFDSTTNNIVFFITDGLHNEYVTEEVLYETLNSFSEKAESKYSHLYYYLKIPDYKEFDFYKVFEKNDNMDVIESLVFTKEVNDTTFVTTPIVADSKGGFEFPMWLLWILLAIIAIIILYFIITKANPLGFGVSVNNNIRTIKGDKALKELENRSQEMAKMAKELSENKGPLFGPENQRFENKDDGGFSVGFDGTNSRIDVDKDGVIHANSGGTEDNGQLNEFLNGNRQLPNATYKVNGDAEYRTDSEGRVKEAIADRTAMNNNPIKISSQRDSATQKIASENREGYDGGHIFSNSTNGCNNTINQVPMRQDINRNGEWRKLERQEEGWLKEGKHLITKRKIIYKGPGSKVVDRIITTNIVDGKTMLDVVVEF